MKEHCFWEIFKTEATVKWNGTRNFQIIWKHTASFTLQLWGQSAKKLTDNCQVFSALVQCCLITRIFEKSHLSKLLCNVLQFLLLWSIYLIYTQIKTEFVDAFRKYHLLKYNKKKLHENESVKLENINMKKCSLKRP